ncbi:MAG TPA: hypothetical protein VF061_07100, partial [Gemmatimonadales bacterium]
MRTRKLDHEGVFAWIMPVVVAGLLAACGGGDAGAGGGAGETAGGTGAGTPAGGAGAEAPAGGAGAEAPPPAAGGGGASALVALGDSVFHGQAGGGTCYVCHGQDGKGSGV